jgi:hypothetical protein
MDSVSFMYGFADELRKHAAAKPKAKPKAEQKGSLGWRAINKGAPYALIAGVPVYLAGKAIEKASEGFGRGVSEEANKPLPYER